MDSKSNATTPHAVTRRLAAAAAALALASVAAPAQQPQQAATAIRNFDQVNANYFRGGQPEAGQYGELKRLGVRAVVDLRKERAADAAERARAAGLAYFNIPLEAGTPATAGQTAEFLRLVNDPANWPVYVHCEGGRQRTGAMTAAYRIASDGWTADRAFDEMLKYGRDDAPPPGSPFLVNRERQRQFVFAFYEQHASSIDPGRAN